MDEFIKGDIVVVPFPFSDLTGKKRRPALVVANYGGPDVISAQITSRAYSDPLAIPLIENEIEVGTLNRKSFIRPNKLFTSEQSFISYKIGSLKKVKVIAVADSLIQIFSM